VNRAVVKLLETAFAGDFSRQVCGIAQLSPAAALFWEKGVCEAIADILTTAVPIVADGTFA